MTKLHWALAALVASSALAGCTTQDRPATASTTETSVGGNSTDPGTTTAPATPATGTSSDGQTGGTAGTGTTGTTGGTGTSGSVPTLISVNLQNVLNNLSVQLQVNRNNIPVTAQVPIDVAASVCGVSVDALAASVASGNGKCTATTTSASLNQAVQQQIASGGNVTGGAQTMGSTPPR